MSSVTFPEDLGGDGSTVTDDDNASTGLGNGGHRLRFVPALAQSVIMAQTAKDKASAAASSASAAASSASAAASSESSAGSHASAAQSHRNAAASSESNAESAASSAASDAAQVADDRQVVTQYRADTGDRARSAREAADRAEFAADGLAALRTVEHRTEQVIEAGEGDGGKHFLCESPHRQEIRLLASAKVGRTVYAQAHGTGWLALVADTGVLRSRGGRNHVLERYGMVTAVKTGPGEWTLSGDLDPVTTETEAYQLASGQNYQLAGSGEDYHITRTVAA